MQKYEHLNRDVKMGQFIYQSRKNGGAYRISSNYRLLGRAYQIAGFLGLFWLDQSDSRSHVT